jgi:hypothetical protein
MMVMEVKGTMLKLRGLDGPGALVNVLVEKGW